MDDQQDMFSAKAVAQAMGLTSDTNLPMNKTSERSTKPSDESVIAIATRLGQLSMKRRAKTPDPELFTSYASSLSRFPLSVIDTVCTQIEESPRRQGEPTFPDLGTLIEMCRREASRIVPKEGRTYWSLSDYRECVWFDRFLKDQTQYDPEHPNRVPKTGHEIRDAFPSMARLHMRWLKAMQFKMVDCPDWCDECEGQRIVVRYADGSKPWSLGRYDDSPEGHANKAVENEKRKTLSMSAVPCPTCRPQQAVERKPPTGYPAHSSGAKVVYR